jgi:hypothetical protein
MKLTSEDQKSIARRASWFFDCDFGKDGSDSVVYTGDGVDDLDALISRMEFAYSHSGIGVKAKFLADTGSAYSSWKPFDIDDLKAIRGYYAQDYGPTDKPDAYASQGGSAIEV